MNRKARNAAHARELAAAMETLVLDVSITLDGSFVDRRGNSYDFRERRFDVADIGRKYVGGFAADPAAAGLFIAGAIWVNGEEINGG